MTKTVLDSGFYAVDSEYRYWIPAPFSEELRFRIPTSCSQFTNWGVKKLIASCFTEIFFLFFFFWKLRHRITADGNDCFPLAGTHFPTGNSGVVYIFYGLWALSSTEIRLGVIVFPLCEVSGGAKIERFNKILCSTSPCPFEPLWRRQDRGNGQRKQLASHEVLMRSVPASCDQQKLKHVYSTDSCFLGLEETILIFYYLLNTWQTHRKDVI